MVDECPMTEECPGYDRDRRVCLLRADDCELAAVAREPAPVFDAPRVAGASGDEGAR